jgi:hypothetical protein
VVELGDCLLAICNGGWAPSMVLINGKLMSGVEAAKEFAKEERGE